MSRNYKYKSTLVTTCDDNVVIITENGIGDIYMITANCIQDILDDWNGKRAFCPANDACVFFFMCDGMPLNWHDYSDFESLLQLLKEIQEQKEVEICG